MSVRARVLATATCAVLAFSGMSVGAAPASATDTGDWKLHIGPRVGSCADFEEPWCGNALFLRTQVWPNQTEEDVDVSGTLTKPDGARMTFEYGSMGILFSGANDYSNTYMGQYAAWDSRTGSAWPHGKYVFKVKLSDSGVWDCSIYYESGCIWFEDWSITKAYEFTWTGAPMTVSQARIKATTAPTVKGTHEAGKKLWIGAPKWVTTPSTLLYRWTRNGHDISGATNSTYWLKRADAGQKIAVRIRGKKSGYISGSTTSAAVRIAG